MDDRQNSQQITMQHVRLKKRGKLRDANKDIDRHQTKDQ